jgi:hypothetical protein
MGLLDIFGGTKAPMINVPTQLAGQEERDKRFLEQIGGLNQQAGQAQFNSPFRTAQTGLLPQLQQQAQGQGPSVADQMLRNAQQNNVAQGMAMAASQRGVNPAMAMRNAMQSTAQANQGAAAQAMPARVQEQLGAQQNLMQAAQAGRGQDLQYENQTRQLAAQYEQMGLNQAQALMQAQIDVQKANQSAQLQNANAERNMLGQAFGGAAGFLGNMGLGNMFGDLFAGGGANPTNVYDASTRGQFLGMGGQYDPNQARGYGAKQV